MFIATQPVMFTLLFVYVFGGTISGSSRQYIRYVIPGVIVQTVVFSTMLTGTGLNEDLQEHYRPVPVLPIARSAVLSGRILADAIRLTATVGVIVLVGACSAFASTSAACPPWRRWPWSSPSAWPCRGSRLSSLPAPR